MIGQKLLPQAVPFTYGGEPDLQQAWNLSVFGKYYNQFVAGPVATDANQNAGGGAHLRGLNRRIEERTGIRTVIADDADLCVVRGTGEALKFIDVISRNSLNRRETYI